MMILAVLVLLSFAYLTYRDFKLALVILLALLPTYLIRFSIGPVPTTLLECLVLVILGFWFFKEKGRMLEFLRSLGPYRVPMLLLLASSCFAVVVEPDTFAALGIWKAYFIEPFLLFFVFRSTFTARKDWERAFFALGGTVVALSLFALVQRATGLGIPAPWDIELRATSFFDFPNALGLFVAPIVTAAVVYASCFGHPLAMNRRITAIVIAVFGLLACFLSQTEAVFVAIPSALLIVLMFSTAPLKIKAYIGSAVLLIGFACFMFVPTVHEKLLLQDISGQARLAQWHETTTYLKSHWLTGAGLAGYPTAIKPYHDGRIFEIFQYPHNILLNFWVELGLLGVIALLGFIVSTSRVTLMRRGDVFTLMAFGALATMVIHGLVDVPFFKNDLAILTVAMLAMTLAPPPTPPWKGGE
ncbi:MAG: O-antigen ligase family protein [Patescibacteria group bacterium]|jgi:O-antigen ligase